MKGIRRVVLAISALVLTGSASASDGVLKRLGVIPAVVSAGGQAGSRWESAIYIENPQKDLKKELVSITAKIKKPIIVMMGAGDIVNLTKKII